MGDYDSLLMIGGAFLCFLEGVEKVLHMLEARKHKRFRRRASSVWRSWRQVS
ncbi:DUF808 family protein [Shigella boydii]